SVEVRLVGQTNQHARVKRTLQEKHGQTGVEPMPDHLHFRLQLGARQVDLQMGKSRKGLSGFPVFVIEDGQIKRKELKQDN
ncbi:A disintegrin and metalloproteinase with thrombospondin motifs 17, partial [Biomphalaria glabrata]